jgi:hypothetical protein
VDGQRWSCLLTERWTPRWRAGNELVQGGALGRRPKSGLPGGIGTYADFDRRCQSVRRRLSVNVLVTGAGGQLGLELTELLPRKGHEVRGANPKRTGHRRRAVGRRALEEHAPELVVNAAAYTDVDGSETETIWPTGQTPWARATSPSAASAGAASSCTSSTNYVFDGTGERPYEPFDAPNPVKRLRTAPSWPARSTSSTSRTAGISCVPPASTVGVATSCVPCYGRPRGGACSR